MGNIYTIFYTLRIHLKPAQFYKNSLYLKLFLIFTPETRLGISVVIKISPSAIPSNPKLVFFDLFYLSCQSKSEKFEIVFALRASEVRKVMNIFSIKNVATNEGW